MGSGRLPEPSERRASDADRERIVAMLRAAAGDGALDIDELDERIGQAFKARTVGELATVVWDLPLPPEPPSARRRRRGLWRNIGFRYHAASYGLANGFLVGTWAVTGGDYFFWPFFPAAGWGVGLALHALAVKTKETKETKETKALEHDEQRAQLPPAQFQALSRPRPTVVDHRRFVAVLFTDVANSTRLAEALGDAEWNRVRSRHREILRTCFSDHKGSEVNSQGDGFLARFPSPVDAVRCAIAVQRRLEDQRGTAGFAPTVRIGVHAGEVLEEDGDLVGRVINLASRVMGEAEPGEILVTEPVADHLDNRFEVEDRGLHALKGVPQPRHLLAVLWEE